MWIEFANMDFCIDPANRNYFLNSSSMPSINHCQIFSIKSSLFNSICLRIQSSGHVSGNYLAPENSVTFPIRSIVLEYFSRLYNCTLITITNRLARQQVVLQQ